MPTTKAVRGMADETRLKELKVTVPMDLYLKVLRLKLVTGQTIAATMEAALRAHFEAIERGEEIPAPRNRDEPPARRS
jgi:post-segregation antitoxin (ccd killing protein)